MDVWINNRKIRNERKTLLKVKCWKILRGGIPAAHLLKPGLFIVPFIVIGFLLRYLAVSNEITVPYTQDTTPPVPVEKKQAKIEPVEYTFKAGDTFYEVLLDFRFPPQDIFQVIESSKTIYDVKRITPGSTIILTIDPAHQTLNRLEYRFDDHHVLVVNKTDGGYTCSQEEIIYDITLRTITGTIKNNLFDDAIKAGGNPQLILNLADSFAWDVDFSSSLRENDSFKLLFEEIYEDGEFIKHGKILAAEFVNKGSLYRAFRFEDDRGSTGYYDDRGRSLAREFLKSPLRYSRISSRFTKKRFHPILKTYRPHLGVDYAAPTGTPVEATSQGTIIYCGRKGNYGKCIKIRHNHLYTSFYGHLSRFAKGMKKGKRVKQGQVIGYVGTTGLSTGPHLDYRLQKRGNFINPLNFKSPQKHAVTKELRPSFEKHKRELLLKLEQLDEELLRAHTNPPANLLTANRPAGSSHD
jgi:murein DD-endopeptidase MepM/ murein hydrolase activator NlpD